MPIDDQSIEEQEYIVEVSKGCRSKHAPCPACMAGGICDNFDYIEGREDQDDEDAEEDPELSDEEWEDDFRP
jgi:hypothetical protein